MSYLDKYTRNKPSSLRELRVSDTKKLFENHYRDTPSYFIVKSANNDLFYEMQINDSSDLKDQKSLTTSIDSLITLGETVNWNNEYWIVVHFDTNMGDVYKRGRMYQCLHQLKWIDDEGAIQNTWFTYYSNDMGSLGIKEGNIFSLPDETRRLIIQNNDYTNKFDKGQRFIFDRRSWDIHYIDRLNSNLIYIVLKEDQFNTATDNLELEIADYNKLAKYEISILNGDMLAIKVGDILQLNVKTTKNGTPIEIPLLFSSSDDSIATVSDTGLVSGVQKGSCNIQVSGKGVSASIELNIIEELIPNYTAEIIGEDSIYTNRTSTYTVTFRNNGSEVADTSKFWISTLDGKSTTDLAVIESQNSTTRTCVVKSNNNRKYGSFILHVENSNGLSTGKNEIKVKSLI
ncbi:Ig-like domain-containing protein [Paenibacillus taichungensis]|uniref:Ig-like domain-containing protein n=1 Tax=Paenibacillus taichungensis TaxID=484184 RepID=UPI0039A0BB09